MARPFSNPGALIRAETVAVDLELDGEAVRAVEARLQDEQVGDARRDALGLESIGRASAVEVGGATCVANNEQVLRVRPSNAGDLQLGLGQLVPSSGVASPAAEARAQEAVSRVHERVLQV